MNNLQDMLMMDLPVPHDDGSFISERVSRVAELVRDYDDRIDIRWIRPNERGSGDPAFAIVRREPNGSEYVIFYVKDESEFDGRVLQRLQSMDQEKGDVLCKIDEQNALTKKVQEGLHKEQLAEATDLAYRILRSPKHTYKHNGVTYE